MKKVVGIVIVLLLIAVVVWFAVTFFEVDTEGEFVAPDVDVEAEGGNIPEMEVRSPDVEVGTEETEVTVPDVDVDTEEREINVPSVDIERPDEEGDVVDR